ncbi:MAG: hypothetical protein ACTHU0_36720 [Kofleriaceae bacterium]
MLPDDAPVAVTRKYFSTRCSELAWENYQTARAVHRLLEPLYEKGLVGHRVAHLYDDEDMVAHFIWDREALKHASSNVLPLLWVSVSWRKGAFDESLLAPIASRYELRMFEEFDGPLIGEP